MARKEFHIHGRVIDSETQQGCAGLRVKAWDKDTVRDDPLGTVITDKEGAFHLVFDTSDFVKPDPGDAPVDRMPDVYFEIFDEGQLIKTTEVMPNIKKEKTEISIEVSGGRELELATARTQFRALIVANPNYFGNVAESSFEPVLPLQGNTTYEEIGCVGYQPKHKQLEAVVYINRPTGYGGNICSDGTPEYVRFYLSYDDGATWEDQGLTSFRAYDIPDVGSQSVPRLEYDVTLDVNPNKKFCTGDNLILARAILSWNNQPPPDTPDHIPVWGNVHDTHIQVDPLYFIILDEAFQTVGLDVPDQLATVLDLSQEIKAAEPTELSAKDLQKMYQGKVEPRRFALTEMQQLLDNPEAAALLAAPGSEGVLQELDIDIDDLVAVLSPGDGNTSFEELECVGLNPNRDTLVGVIRVKKPAGYSGGPCTTGSKEYVTFWADFNNNGTFETCLGTAEVNVYDFNDIPDEGLEYAVSLPVDLTHQRRPCEDGPRLVPIRAIMSWQIQPPCFNPNYVPVWGNREETVIHISPGPYIPPGTVDPKISILGGIPVSMIHDITGLTTPNAIFALNGLTADSLSRPCPFGKRAVVQGPQFPGYKYRVRVRRTTVPGWTTITTPLKVTNSNGDVNDHFPVGDFFAFLPFNQNISNILAWWDTTGDDRWIVRLEVFSFANVFQGADAHRIQLDNTSPDAGVEITSGAGNCGKFVVGDVLSGDFFARDQYFGHYSLRIKPNINTPPIGVPNPSSGNTQTAPAPGDSWTLGTTDMLPCGYIIEVSVRDRSILNSVHGSHHWRGDSAGFCLEEPDEA